MNIQPWHNLCTLRNDVRTGDLKLAEFAADLYDALQGTAPDIYCDPALFFERTYATMKMKLMARDVLQRLAGEGGSPVLRLQVAYGGGKTHTLITMMHLARQGADFAAQSTVKEFQTFAGISQLPHARVAVLPGDKIDVHEGLEVTAPNGHARRVNALWGALAYQLAGDSGYARVREHDEQFTVPAEPLLSDLMSEPQKDGLSTLVLVDEAVWYYRSLSRSKFQVLRENSG
ncbi:DUF499 domain-containing protein [Chloroflexi bacterium TSY]|nr:DUF499 domain-containing protein [Chloroflexi bacterium TSY]